MSQFLIRQYLNPDHKAVWDLHVLALKHANAFTKNDKLDKDLDDIYGNYINNEGDFLVGTIGNRIIAMGGIRKLSDNVAELKRMRVHPDFQKRGYGQQILETLEKRAKKLGYKAIQLDTTITQTAAQSFYKKNGYIEIRRKTEGWPIETIFSLKNL